MRLEATWAPGDHRGADASLQDLRLSRHRSLRSAMELTLVRTWSRVEVEGQREAKPPQGRLWMVLVMHSQEGLRLAAVKALS